jgi:protein TonB
MGLHAERQSGDLKLTWNREAAVISNATSAVLSIEDGDSHRTIPLQANQVRAGSILYTPVSDQVQMELAVSTPADHVTESVLVLLPKTGPPQTLAARPPVHTPPPPAPAPAPASESASRFQQAKQFIPPPEPSRGPSPAISLSEPPAVASASSAPPVSMPLWSHPLVAPPPIVKPAPQAPRPAPVVEPTYYQPETVSQVRPNFPLALKNIIVKPTAVEVVVAIDETGKVVKANVKPQLGLNPLLISASASAAKQWRFRPARQGNQPVASEMLLRFTFSPNP